MLEAKIEALTAAVVELTAAVLASQTTQAARVEAPKAEATKPTKAIKSAKAADPAPPYDEVKAAILTLVQKVQRDAAVNVLKEFGVERGPDLKPEQYAAFLTRANAVLAEADNGVA